MINPRTITTIQLSVNTDSKQKPDVRSSSLSHLSNTNSARLGSSYSFNSNDSFSKNKDEVDLITENINNVDLPNEPQFFQILKKLQGVLHSVGFSNSREARFVDLPTFKGDDQDLSNWLK
ncbi:594_t:CDS:2 [Funneliformis caledonium]|uniref:594_t:CDS:1 n=1 Tax=Funneliformis caledonium TaxID=1117310 RepID=A0A9N9NCD4_9GLOM|nr:594_t:CDS:2 [Funneliformis caledonium]